MADMETREKLVVGQLARRHTIRSGCSSWFPPTAAGGMCVLFHWCFSPMSRTDGHTQWANSGAFYLCRPQNASSFPNAPSKDQNIFGLFLHLVGALGPTAHLDIVFVCFVIGFKASSLSLSLSLSLSRKIGTPHVRRKNKLAPIFLKSKIWPILLLVWSLDRTTGVS